MCFTVHLYGIHDTFVIHFAVLFRMLELLAESKALVRLGIDIPEVAKAALEQVLYSRVVQITILNLFPTCSAGVAYKTI